MSQFYMGAPLEQLAPNRFYGIDFEQLLVTGDGHMSHVIFKCPNTGKDIFTGIETDAESLVQIPNTLMTSRCPHCGLEHKLWKREARLDDNSRPQDLRLATS